MKSFTRCQFLIPKMIKKISFLPLYKEKSGAGFTLIESLITIAVFALITGVISGLILMLYRTHGYTWQQSTAVNEARKGIETMVKEIREAKFGDDGSFPIVKAGNKEFVFYSDIDKDGEIKSASKDISLISPVARIV